MKLNCEVEPQSAQIVILELIGKCSLVPFYGFDPSLLPTAHLLYLLERLQNPSTIETIVLIPIENTQKQGNERRFDIALGANVLHLLEKVWKGEGVYFNAENCAFTFNPNDSNYCAYFDNDVQKHALCNPKNNSEVESFNKLLARFGRIAFKVFVMSCYEVEKCVKEMQFFLDSDSLHPSRLMRFKEK